MKNKIVAIFIAFVLITSIFPLEIVTAETPTAEQVNDYALKIANFVKEKCHGSCENVVILGDDYVIPSFRRDIKLLNWYYFVPWLQDNKTDKILTDIGYVQRKAKTFAEFDELFIINEYGNQYEGKDVVIIVPDIATTKQILEINRLKQILVEKGYKPNFIEKKGSEIYCNDPQLWNNLNGKTIFVFGTEENNQAYNCFPFQAGLENRDTAFIDINPWDGRNYAVIVNTNDADVIRVFANLIKDGGYKNLKSNSAYILKVKTQTASFIVMGVSIVALIVGTGGIATPAILVTGREIIETAVDSADVVDSCVVNPEGFGWCATSVVCAILPGVDAGTKNALKKLADDDVIKALKPFEDLFKKHRKNLQEHFGDVLEVVIKNTDDEIALVKGTDLVLKHIPSGKIDDLYALKAGVSKLAVADGIKSLGSIGDIKGVDNLARSISKANNVGPFFEAKGARVLKSRGKKLSAVSQQISTIEGPTDIDVLTDDTIYEMKSHNFIKYSSGRVYNELIKKLDEQIKKFKAFDSSKKIVIVFDGTRGEIPLDMQQFLSTKGVSWEVIE